MSMLLSKWNPTTWTSIDYFFFNQILLNTPNSLKIIQIEAQKHRRPKSYKLRRSTILNPLDNYFP